jgi:hypothetical protein
MGRAGMTCLAESRWLDDVFHEFAGIGQTVERLAD